MPKLIDLSEVEASFVAMRAHLEPGAETPGAQGTINRAMLAILPVAAMWSAKEINRGTPYDETSSGLVVAVSNIVASEIGGLDLSGEEKLGELERILNNIAGNILHILSDTSGKTHAIIMPIEAGTA